MGLSFGATKSNMGADASKVMEQFIADHIQAGFSSEKEFKEEATKVFNALDKDKTGFLEKKEMETLSKAMVKLHDKFPDGMNIVFKPIAWDANNDGKLDLEEFFRLLKQQYFYDPDTTKLRILDETIETIVA